MTPWTVSLCPWDSPSKNAGAGSCSLFQGIFLTQGSNQGLSHCRQILYHNVVFVSAYSKMIQLYMYIFFFIFLSIMVYYRTILNIVPSKTLLFIHSIYNSLYLQIPNFQSIPSIPTSLLATTSLPVILDLSFPGQETLRNWIWRLLGKYTWPSVPTGSTSTDSTNWRLKIIGKKFRKFQKAKLEFAANWQLFTVWHLHCIYYYLHSIYIVLGFISNLEII